MEPTGLTWSPALSAMIQRPFFKYESSDSVAFLEQPESSVSLSGPEKRLSDLHDEHDHARVVAAPLTVAVSLRRGRLLLLTTGVVAVIVSIVLVLWQGVDLTTFPAASKNATDRSALLDDYNSYSGNVASAFGKPIELFVAVLAQLIALRFMADAYTQPTISRRQFAIRLALSAAIGYLISNGFNAVNVQLFEAKVHAVILASDLSLSGNLSDTVVARTTTVTTSVSERTPGNLISNTVLRNVVLPRVTFKQTYCDWEQTRLEDSSGEAMPLSTVDFGFTQRDWQSRLLQEALPERTLKMVVNPTDKTVNNGMKSSDLPMNASLAADLFLYAMFIGPNVFPWGGGRDFVDSADVEKRYPANTPKDQLASFAETTVIVAGLLPPSDTVSESEKQDWFVKAAMASVVRQFNNSKNTSKSDIGVEFSHVQISPSIDFDAVTLEVAMDPSVLATTSTRGNSTWLTQIAQASPPGVSSNCGPWPGLCLVKKPPYRARPSTFFVDSPQQVHAFGSCVTKFGETLMSLGSATPLFTCNESSNSSIMIMSVGRRLVADSLEQNKSDGVTEMIAEPALITNLRKIYTITIGRLSWRLENLANVFGADCGTKEISHDCMGLQMPLSSSTLSVLGLKAEGVPVNQSLVVSGTGLPTDLIMPPARLYDYKPRSVPLVEVSEPPYRTALGGDILLPHNIKKIVWSNKTIEKDCEANYEGVLYNNMNNHVYIEHSFQVAYTAATFFLLQNAIVKDSIPTKGATTATTLNFDGNQQDIIVTVSTPYQNALQTIVGCGLLMLCVLLAVGKTTHVSKYGRDPLAAITAPQAIARVMLDDEEFPAVLLHRRVVHRSAGYEPSMDRPLGEFRISHLQIVHEQDAAAYRSTYDSERSA